MGPTVESNSGSTGITSVLSMHETLDLKENQELNTVSTPVDENIKFSVLAAEAFLSGSKIVLTPTINSSDQSFENQVKLVSNEVALEHETIIEEQRLEKIRLLEEELERERLAEELLEKEKLQQENNDLIAKKRAENENKYRVVINEENADWVKPVEKGRYTSPYGYREAFKHISSGFHYGVDLAAPINTPIKAASKGVVVEAGYGVAGWQAGLIVIEHDTPQGTYYTLYYHMKAEGILVSKGETVETGEVIALVGNEGRSTGPHLHFEVKTHEKNNSSGSWKTAVNINPELFLKDRHIVLTPTW